MSILIKGMNVPKAGELLQVAENVDGTIFVRETTHGEWHQVVAVSTPHGMAMTNADRIRAMTDEELYKFICDKATCDRCGYASTSGCGLLDWLKQETKDK